MTATQSLSTTMDEAIEASEATVPRATMSAHAKFRAQNASCKNIKEVVLVFNKNSSLNHAAG